MEKIIQGRRNDGRDTHEGFHFKDTPVAFPGKIDIVIEELAKAPLHGQGLHSLADFLGLYHFVEDGYGPLFLRQDPQALQGVPDEDFFLWCDLDVTLDEVGHDPFFGPFDFAFVVDIRQRLEREVAAAFGCQIVEVAADPVGEGS